MSYCNMGNAKRVTIMVSMDVDKKLRNIQARIIKDNQVSHSYSKTIDEVLRKALRL